MQRWVSWKNLFHNPLQGVNELMRKLVDRDLVGHWLVSAQKE